ncbi:MAG TPA: glucose-6-phosphate dehydrogenase assembly protein OpcA [Opitutaceae bacterium]|nr:glucose-6-phosphate dehydrogenase assembly protein OpcA [Opitutaceae bacterium]
MPSIFDALPGTEVPVAEISKSFAAMWADTAKSGGAAIEPDDAKATQVNFVLHLGLHTTAEDAAAQFRTVVGFSKRYPSRIVVLCPQADAPSGAVDMRAKIYAECHLGKSKSDKRCVEFVMLSYPQAARKFLESQVSTCLSTDLPLYYWAHRFSASARLADYHYLLSRAKRVMIDSAIAPADTFTYPWPNPKALRDLVYSRLLPVRQTVGQFLSGYAPDALVGSLKCVTVAHTAALAAEGRVTLAWLQRRLGECGADEAGTPFALQSLPAGGPDGRLAITFDYADAGKFFRWNGNLAAKQATFEADLKSGCTKLSAAASLLPPELALSEAMFF